MVTTTRENLRDIVKTAIEKEYWRQVAKIPLLTSAGVTAIAAVVTDAIAEKMGIEELPIELGELRHYVLYAKGWYARRDLVEDLRKITAHVTACPRKYISRRDIYAMLLSVYFRLVPEVEKRAFIEELPFSKLFPKKGYGIRISFPEILSMILRKLYRITVTRENSPGDREVLVILGEPDPKVLPLAK